MVKPTRSLRGRSYLVLILILYALALPLTAVLAAIAAPGVALEAATPLPANRLTFQVYTPIILKAGWTELARSPGGSYGSQTLGRWRRISWDAYKGCRNAARCSYFPFEPTDPSDAVWGSLANWWTEGYNDSSWSRQGWVVWSTVWEQPQWNTISAIGHYAWSAEEPQTSKQTDLHRRQFTLNVKARNARITIFSDNTSTWYLNGHAVVSGMQGGLQSNISPDMLHCGDNLLAVQVNNDNDINPVNPVGLQYIVEAVLDPSQPCRPSVILTTTATVSTALGQAVHDTAHLSGGASPLTGTLTFNVYGPDDTTCSTPMAVPPAIGVNGVGDYSSGNFTPTLPGTYRWIAHYSGNAHNPAVSTACNDPNETSAVVTITLTTNAAPAPVRQTIHDTAHLRGGDGTPTGTITFDVFAPTDTACATPIAVPPAVTVNGAGDYASGNYTPTMTGNYHWIAHYSGDGINPALSTACNDPAEISSVQPRLSLAKSASPTTYTTVGQVVTYAYSVTNSSHVTLNGPITVSDDRATNVICPAVSSFAPGASITCSATYVVTQADLNNGSVTNHAIAQALFGGSPVASNPAQATVYAASIALSKSASPTTYHSAGEVITYTYIVTNTGQTTLSGPVTVNDDRLGTFACGPAADLTSGASVTCTRTYVIQPADLGNVLNLPNQQPTNATYGPWLGGGNSTQDVLLSGNAPGSDVPNGTYAGWCVEESITGNLSGQLATLYTSTHLNLPADIAGLPWGKVNYVLNHKLRGVGKTDREFFMDVQTAIWVVLGEPAPTWGISSDAQRMIDAANAHPGYVPGVTDTVAVIVYSDGLHPTGDVLQEVILEAKLGQIINHATVTATSGSITVTSNPAVVTIRFVPIYNAVTIKLPSRPAVKSKS